LFNIGVIDRGRYLLIAIETSRLKIGRALDFFNKLLNCQRIKYTPHNNYRMALFLKYTANGLQTFGTNRLNFVQYGFYTIHSRKDNTEKKLS
jgi:hypothetical protein